MLLDNDNGDFFGELSQPFRYLLCDADPDAFGRFIEQQELGIGQDGPADRQHFALTSRKCSCRLLEALSELREPCEHLIDRRPLSVCQRTHLEVLAHAQSAKDGMLLRHVAQTRTNPTLGWQPRDVLTIQRNASAAG